MAASGLNCGSQDLCCIMWGLSLWWTNSVVAAHGIWDLSSLTRDQTHILCIARWILNYWTARRVLKVPLFDLLLFYLHVDTFLDSQFCPTDLVVYFYANAQGFKILKISEIFYVW